LRVGLAAASRTFAEARCVARGLSALVAFSRSGLRYQTKPPRQPPQWVASPVAVQALRRRLGTRFTASGNPFSPLRANARHMELETLQDLYIYELKDLYSAEKQLVRALPKMAQAAKNEQLSAGIQKHLEQTKQHAARLEKILSSHKQSTRGAKCKGMAGIIAEGAEMIEEEADPEVKDAGLISAAQRVEHYEIAGYGTVRTYAELLGDKEGAKLLHTTLQEEEETDKELTKVAKSAINLAAAK